jgi:hypothetical protein
MQLRFISTSVKGTVIDSEICKTYTMSLLHIVEQNYYEHVNFCKLKKGVLMGLPMSEYISEVFLQHLEQKVAVYGRQRRALAVNIWLM